MFNKEKIKQEVLDYLTEVIEQPRQEFSGFPVCPFAANDRKLGNLHIDIFDAESENIADRFVEFDKSPHTIAIYVQFFEPDEMPHEDTKKYQVFLNKLLKHIGLKHLKVICFNPNSSLDIDGYNPRSQAPYFLISIANKEELHHAQKSLLKTKYYDAMDTKYKKYLGVKK